MKNLLLPFLMAVTCLSLTAQELSPSVYSSLRPWPMHMADRFDILYPEDTLGPGLTNFKPFLSSDLAAFHLANAHYSPRDSFNAAYLRLPYDFGERSEKPVLRHFYRHPAHLYQVNTRDFRLAVNPLIHFEYGRNAGVDEHKYINTRGVEIYGDIAGKIGFYSNLLENQANLPEYVKEKVSDTRVIPGEGRRKGFKERSYDWHNATGYIIFRPIKQVNIQFGQDKNFIGNGYRSLILSDNSKNYTFLKMNTRVWKINYTNLFTEMVEFIGTADQYLPRKYVTLHHLGIEILPNLEIGLFEGVVYGNSDTTATRNFDLNYLNPIIFYRSVEYHLGSSDNMLIGMDWKWNFLDRFSFYGQLVLDEFKYWELVKGTGWWANKFGVQTGLKYINAFGIPHLDLQAELNTVRPYTYTHFNESINYSHFAQPLAHPLGANFTEAIGIIRYQPVDRLFLTMKLINSNYGADNDTSNFGSNIFANYRTYEREYDNYIGQGFPTHIFHADILLSYMFRHDLWIDLRYIHREVNSVLPGLESEGQYFGVALRWNVGQRFFDF